MSDRCAVSDCEADAVTRGWCLKHYTRWTRHGSPDVVASDRRWTSSGGYSRVFRPDHPLSDAWGAAYEHRIVLFDAIGPGLHDCHWCGRPLEWGGEEPSEALCVDHLDRDRRNNHVGNLVPSCSTCNSQRDRLTIPTCKRGHEYPTETTRRNDGSRVCPTCLKGCRERANERRRTARRNIREAS